MSNRLGMDAGLVRSYADQMDGLADALSSVVASVNASVGHLSSAWLGADAHELAQRWQYHDRDTVALLATHVRDLARIARTNAAEQDRASGAGVGAGGAALGPMGAADASRPFLDRYEKSLSNLTGALDVPHKINVLDHVFRTVPLLTPGVLKLEDRWHRAGELAAGLGAGVLSSRLLSHVHPPADSFSRIAKTAGGSVKLLGAVGTGVTVGTKTVDAVSDFGNGHTSDGVRDIADGTSAVLKQAGPWAYVGGVALAEASDLSSLAEQVDWSAPMPALTASNLTSIYLPAVGEAFTQVPGHLWKWFS